MPKNKELQSSSWPEMNPGPWYWNHCLDSCGRKEDVETHDREPNGLKFSLHLTDQRIREDQKQLKDSWLELRKGGRGALLDNVRWRMWGTAGFIKKRSSSLSSGLNSYLCRFSRPQVFTKRWESPADHASEAWCSPHPFHLYLKKGKAHMSYAWMFVAYMTQCLQKSDLNY